MFLLIGWYSLRPVIVFTITPTLQISVFRLSVLAGSDGVDVGPGWSVAIMMSLGPSNQTFCTENKLDIKLGRLPLSKGKNIQDILMSLI